MPRVLDIQSQSFFKTQAEHRAIHEPNEWCRAVSCLRESRCQAKQQVKHIAVQFPYLFILFARGRVGYWKLGVMYGSLILIKFTLNL